MQHRRPHRAKGGQPVSEPVLISNHWGSELLLGFSLRASDVRSRHQIKPQTGFRPFLPKSYTILPDGQDPERDRSRRTRHLLQALPRTYNYRSVLRG